jgi:hypothetical protein
LNTHVSAPPAGVFSVPARHNPKLQALVERINADEELRQLWRCANLNAVERLGLSDHGETHIRIVANASLRLLRLLAEAGITPNLVTDYGLGREEAEVAVVLAAALHDIGLVVHYDGHHGFSPGLAYHKACALLQTLYGVRERTILAAEVLHAIAAHTGHVRCLTLEAGSLHVADALDMTKGRSRPPDPKPLNSLAEAGATIEEVSLLRGLNRPVRIEIRMKHAAGIPYAEALLETRLAGSTLAERIEVVARIETAVERRLVPILEK